MWKPYWSPYIPTKVWDTGGLPPSGHIPCSGLIPLIPNPPLRKLTKSQALPGAAQGHPYKLRETFKYILATPLLLYLPKGQPGVALLSLN